MFETNEFGKYEKELADFIINDFLPFSMEYYLDLQKLAVDGDDDLLDDEQKK